MNGTAEVYVQTEFLGCTFSWHKGREKSQISTDFNYFYLKHKHYLLIKCMEWQFKMQITDGRIYLTIFQPTCATRQACKIFYANQSLSAHSKRTHPQAKKPAYWISDKYPCSDVLVRANEDDYLLQNMYYSIS